MNIALSPEDVTRELKLTPLPDEGGLFRQTFADDHSSAIYYLIVAPDYSGFHTLGYPQIVHFYAGSPARMLLLHGDGTVAEPVLGIALSEGQRPQVPVPPGTWRAIESQGAWTLLGATMAPGYTPESFELGTCASLAKQFPAVMTHIERLTRR